MLQFVKRVPFPVLLSALTLITLAVTMVSWLARPIPCTAKQIGVELVWNFGQAGWVEVTVTEGRYILKSGEEQVAFKPGSRVQLGWGGWAPIWQMNQEGFVTWRHSSLELRPDQKLRPDQEPKSGSASANSFEVRTPDGKSFIYRGSLVISWESDHWKLINYLEDEDYLKGVVPIEMSNTWAGEGLEALKAQAVAARTYLVKHTEASPVITDSPNIHQAYLGRSVEGAASLAVEQTRNEILVDWDTRQPITAFYSSHNGGYTEEAQNVWQNDDRHYSAHPDSFTSGVGGFLDAWYFIVSAPTLGEKFGLGPVQKVELDKWPSGRVKKVSMEDWHGNQKSVSGRELVRAFYPYGQSISANAFLGSLFKVKYVATGDSQTGWGFQQKFPLGNRADYVELSGPRLGRIISSQEGTTVYSQPYGVYIFTGSGWGHGVGMSQWGAYHMAKLGYSYAEILTYYYDHVLLIEVD